MVCSHQRSPASTALFMTSDSRSDCQVVLNIMFHSNWMITVSVFAEDPFYVNIGIQSINLLQTEEPPISDDTDKNPPATHGIRGRIVSAIRREEILDFSPLRVAMKIRQ